MSMPLNVFNNSPARCEGVLYGECGVCGQNAWGNQQLPAGFEIASDVEWHFRDQAGIDGV
jgi:hypothetical protein